MNAVVLLLWVLQLLTYAIQKMAEKLSECTFPSLHSHCEASAVGSYLISEAESLHSSFI